MTGIEIGMRPTSLTVPHLLVYLFALVLAHCEYGDYMDALLGLVSVLCYLCICTIPTYLSN